MLHLRFAGRSYDISERIARGCYAEQFGVTKYQYPIPQNMSGDVEAPIGQYKFPSPENLKRYRDVLFQLGLTLLKLWE